MKTYKNIIEGNIINDEVMGDDIYDLKLQLIDIWKTKYSKSLKFKNMDRKELEKLFNNTFNSLEELVQFLHNKQ